MDITEYEFVKLVFFRWLQIAPVAILFFIALGKIKSSFVDSGIGIVEVIFHPGTILKIAPLGIPAIACYYYLASFI